MMELMRKMAPAIIVVVVLVFGATSFVVFGTNNAQMKEWNKAIGTVGNTEISRIEYDRAYNAALKNSRSDMSDEQRRQLPMQVWEELVSKAISETIAEEMKLGATSAEVLQSLIENPPAMLKQSPYFFDESGKFNEAKYREVMSTPETYDSPEIKYLESYIRSMIPNQKLGQLVEQSNFVSPAEVAEQYHRDTDKVKFEYLMVRPYAMKIDPVSDDAVAAYYNENKDQFETKEQAELYFVKILKKANAYDEKVITEQLVEIKKNILSGETSFEEEADIESDDAQTAANGGDISWMVKGDFPAFDPVFDLKAGEISEPIKSPIGIHLVKVDSVDTENEKGRLKLKHILKLIVPTVVTLDSLDALSDGMLTAAEESDIFEAAQKFGQRVDSTGLYGRGDKVPGVGYHAGLGNFTFDEDADAKFELYENEGGYYLVTVKERIAEGVLPLERVTSKVKQILRDSLQLKAAEEYLASKVGSVTGTLSEFAETDSLITAGTSEEITRNDFVSGVGKDNKVIATAFTAELNKLSAPVVESNGVFAVKPLTREIAKEVPVEEVAKIEKAIRDTRKRTLFTEWYTAYREQLGVDENVRKYYY